MQSTIRQLTPQSGRGLFRHFGPVLLPEEEDVRT
jgi:hypothetical protein